MPHARYDSPTGPAEVWWDSTGEGTPVVLINGLGSPSDAWFRLVPLLAGTHRVLTVDNLGTGRTQSPPAPWTVSTLAGGVAAAIEAAGESSAHVLGISLGGMIAQVLVQERPELVRSLCLVATHAGFPHMSGDPEAKEAILAAGHLEGEERYAALAPFAHSPSCPPERIAEDIAKRATQPTSQEGYDNQLAAAVPFDGLAALSSVSKPTFVLHGADDRLVASPSGQLLADNIPDAKILILPDAGHQLFTDQPEAGSLAVLEFLAAVDGA